MTTEQKIDALTKDFLDRDGDTFVRIRRNGRLGWESTLPEDGSYSEYMLHPESQEDLISNAYRLAGEIITVMDSPFKVNIRITPDTSCTDSKDVWVATKVFDDPDLPVGRKLDTFIGLAVHEGCHLLYTDFKLGASCPNEVVRSLQNIIEDERIERVLGESKPGLANFLKASKYYYFDKYRAELERQGRMDSLDTFTRLMNCILAFIRYPKALSVSDLNDFCDPMLKVRDIMIPYPSSTAESAEAASRIYEVIKEFICDERKDKDKESSGGSGEDGKQSTDGEGDSGEGADPATNKESQTEKEIEKSMSRMQDALKNICSGPEKSGLNEDDLSETVMKEGGRVGQVCEGRLERGLQPGSFIERGTEDRTVYESSLERVRRYVPAVSRALKCSSTEYRLSLRGMRSGILDTGKLAEAYQGVPTVYVREGEVKTDRISVCILIDESGSMWGQGEEAARDTAVLLNEALGCIGNVDLFIYGHTASRSTTSLFVYREKGFAKRYSLGSTDARAGNHDSIAIREAAGRVRRFTAEKCLFFIISDGAPNESTDLVRKAVNDVEKDGFKVVAISIDPYYDPSTMYSHNVNLTDMSTLAIDLGKMVKKAVMDNTRKHINY